MDIILDRQLNTLRHIMEAVGMGTIEGDFLNLSEGFDNQYTDLGTVYLQIVPGWYLTTEQNLGSPGNVYDNLKNASEIIDSKTGEPVKGNPLKYPLFCFTNVKLRTLDLPLKFSTKENGKAWTVKVQASYEKLYKTSDEVKEDLLKAAVVDPKLAFTKFDFGPSLKQRGRMVIDVVKDGLKTSAKLGLIAALWATVAGVVLGASAALKIL